MRKHQHKEEKRTRKMKRLIERLGVSVIASNASLEASKKALAKTAKSLESNETYQAWKRRN